MGELSVARGLGDADFKEKDMQFVISRPDVFEHSIVDDDEFLVLACDGLYDVMNNQDIASFIKTQLKDHQDQDLAVKAIVHHAIKQKYSKDNVSVIYVPLK